LFGRCSRGDGGVGDAFNLGMERRFRRLEGLFVWGPGRFGELIAGVSS